MSDAPRLRLVRTAEPEPLWREVLGERLRTLRRRRGLTLTDVAARAGISPQYLSEIERGRKDPSSEMLAAVAGALGYRVLQLTSVPAVEARGGRPSEGRGGAVLLMAA